MLNTSNRLHHFTALSGIRCFVLAATGLIPICCAAQDSGELATPILPVAPPPKQEPEAFEWRPAINQSMRFLLIQHGFRLAFQPGTRARLGGPFFSDWWESVKATEGWGDGDNPFINYVGHPMQGAMSGYIQVQNDPKGKKLEFGRDGTYWRSRLKALAWNFAYSEQFELGPISESSLGNVGQRKGTSGYSDHVVTPAGGLVVMVAEDVLDRFLVRKLESKTDSGRMKAFYRTTLNPCRSFANVLRGKKPWHRDTRDW